MRNVNGYNGKKFAVEITESVNIPNDAGLWSGGIRDLFFAVDMENQRIMKIPNQDSGPFGKREVGGKIELKTGYALARHYFFMGKDMGLVFYIAPSNAALFVTESVSLSDHESMVLLATATYKASYGGRSRYEMYRDDYSYSHRKEPFPSPAQWESAKESLIAKGMLMKNGAITPLGRNNVKRK